MRKLFLVLMLSVGLVACDNYATDTMAAKKYAEMAESYKDRALDSALLASRAAAIATKAREGATEQADSAYRYRDEANQMLLAVKKYQTTTTTTLPCFKVCVKSGKGIVCGCHVSTTTTTNPCNCWYGFYYDSTRRRVDCVCNSR